MDISSFLPINTKIRVNLLIDAIQSQTTYLDLDELKTDILLNIRSFKMQLYFNEKFKILEEIYSLRPPRSEPVKQKVFPAKLKASKKQVSGKSKRNKKKKTVPKANPIKGTNTNGKPKSVWFSYKAVNELRSKEARNATAKSLKKRKNDSKQKASKTNEGTNPIVQQGFTVASKYKGVRQKRANGNLNFFKLIFTNHPKS